MKKIGVYQIELNGKIYVGSSSHSIKKRWDLHLHDLRKGNHHNPYLQNAFNKYGEDALMFSILEIVETPEECIVVEQKYLDKLKPEYNVLIRAGSRLGSKMLEGTRKKMIGRVVSEETREKIRVSNTGHKASIEARQKISNTKKGNKYWVGKKHTEESKQKISESKKGQIPWNKGIPQTEETKHKLSQRMIGRKTFLRHKHSEETKQKLKDANLGKIASSETREKMSKSHKGRTFTEETKRKISEKMKEVWRRRNNGTTAP